MAEDQTAEEERQGSEEEDEQQGTEAGDEQSGETQAEDEQSEETQAEDEQSEETQASAEDSEDSGDEEEAPEDDERGEEGGKIGDVDIDEVDPNEPTQDDDVAAAQMRKLEKEGPPEKLGDWPTGKAMYLTFGGSEGGEGYEDGSPRQMGPSSLRHYPDGSVEVQGEMVDNPEEYKGDETVFEESEKLGMDKGAKGDDEDDDSGDEESAEGEDSTSAESEDGASAEGEDSTSAESEDGASAEGEDGSGEQQESEETEKAEAS